MLMNTLHRGRVGLLLSLLGGTVAGCGAVYTPQEFEKSGLTYGYKGDFDVAIEVVPMTFMSARAANSDGYVPKTLPSSFSQTEAAGVDSPRAAPGVYDVTPPLILDPAPPVIPYESDGGILQPVPRNETLAPLAYPEPLFLPLPVPAYGAQSSLPPRTDRSRAPEAMAGRMPASPRGQGFSTGTRVYSTDIDPDILLERPQLRRRVTNNPLPYIEPRPYQIGPGDVIGLQLRLTAAASVNERASAAPAAQRFLVQDTGEIFIPQVGAISLEGRTLTEARRVISDRLVASGLGLDPGVQIVEFGSKSVSVSGLDEAKLIPISVRPMTLGEAVVSTGGFGARPENTVVRVLRGESIYEMQGDRILTSGGLSRRILMDGDLVAVTSSYDPDSALAYFDQQLRLRDLDRAALADDLAATQERRADAQERRADAQERRSDGSAALSRTRLDLDLRRDRLAEDRARREAEIARLQSRRETDRLNREARIANIEARQAYLDRLRAVEQLNREAMRAARQENRTILSSNQAERVRARAERLRILELELQREEARLDRMATQRREARDLFAQRRTLGAVEQDYVTVAGETQRQTTMPLPFDGRLTLTRVLYDENNGINPLSGDSSEIYVIRTPRQDMIQDKMIAYHLNASNPAALAVASIFEMRPNDVVYVNPQPITKWNRVITQILPSTGLLQSGFSTASGLN